MCESAWWSPAKLNLFLEVLGKRDDGYHELETVMVPIDLADRMTFRLIPEPQCRLSYVRRGDLWRQLPSPENNLIVRALELLRQTQGISQGIEVKLQKNIPLQAGLGGGSSNAATALLAANELWQLNLSSVELIQYAAQIGSDVPFFIDCRPALCRGRGEIVEPINPLISLPGVIICPPFGLSTQDVFQQLDLAAERKSAEKFLAGFSENCWKTLASFAGNRLQSAAKAIRGEFVHIHDAAQNLNPLICQMTGSGSCWFALFTTNAMARRGQRTLHARLPDCRILRCQTISRRIIDGDYRGPSQTGGRPRESTKGVL